MRYQSKKRAALRGARERCVQAVLERDGSCRASETVGFRVVCRGSLEVHEILTRARGGSIVDPENCVALCAAHHRWVHANPAAAVELGMLAHSWDVA